MAQLNADIPKQLKRDLELYCVTNEVKKKEVVEMALRQWMQDKQDVESTLKN